MRACLLACLATLLTGCGRKDLPISIAGIPVRQFCAELDHRIIIQRLPQPHPSDDELNAILARQGASLATCGDNFCIFDGRLVQLEGSRYDCFDFDPNAEPEFDGVEVFWVPPDDTCRCDQQDGFWLGIPD